MTMSPARVGLRWTDEEDALLKKEINDGTDLYKIAAAHERNVDGIRSRILRHVDVTNVDKVAHMFDVTPERMVFITAFNYGEEWDKAQDDWLLRYIQRHSVRDAAIKMRRTEYEITSRLEAIAARLVREEGYPLIFAFTLAKVNRLRSFT